MSKTTEHLSSLTEKTHYIRNFKHFMNYYDIRQHWELFVHNLKIKSKLSNLLIYGNHMFILNWNKTQFKVKCQNIMTNVWKTMDLTSQYVVGAN